MKGLVYTGFLLVILSQGLQVVHNYTMDNRLDSLENRVERLESRYLK